MVDDWITDYLLLGHNISIVFIECKIDGDWYRTEVKDQYNSVHGVLCARNSENCQVTIIEPDGLKRILLFTKGATINKVHNVFLYHSGQADEITVDEKEQAGYGKTRDKIL